VADDLIVCEKTRKRSYRTKREADADIARFRGRSGRQPIRSYQCDACFGFHITAAPSRRAGPRR
jgi:hypothetical protein